MTKDIWILMEAILLALGFAVIFFAAAFLVIRKMVGSMETVLAGMQESIDDAEQMADIMTEASPISYVLLDNDLKPVDCNSEAVRLFGYTDKQSVLDNYWGCLMPESQPDGQKSADKVRIMHEKVLLNVRNIFEWHFLSGDELIPTELTVTRMMHKGEIFIIVFIYDLRNIQKMEKNLHLLEAEVEQIYYDPMTGIRNRRFMDKQMKQVLNYLSRSGSLLTLMMIDIDFFKRYNDTYGHLAGDECLKTVAKTLAESIMRTSDFVVRYGGEEFMIVLPFTHEEGAQIVAERLLENVRKCNIPHEKNEAAEYVTISIGVVTGKVEHTQNESDYIKRADELLYRSKEEGRNRFTFGTLLQHMEK